MHSGQAFDWFLSMRWGPGCQRACQKLPLSTPFLSPGRLTWERPRALIASTSVVTGSFARVTRTQGTNPSKQLGRHCRPSVPSLVTGSWLKDFPCPSPWQPSAAWRLGRRAPQLSRTWWATVVKRSWLWRLVNRRQLKGPREPSNLFHSPAFCLYGIQPRKRNKQRERKRATDRQTKTDRETDKETHRERSPLRNVKRTDTLAARVLKKTFGRRRAREEGGIKKRNLAA